MIFFKGQMWEEGKMGVSGYSEILGIIREICWGLRGIWGI